MGFVSSLGLVGLSQEMIVVPGLPLNVDTIILGCIFSMVLSDFTARKLKGIPTSPMTALTEFFPCR